MQLYLSFFAIFCSTSIYSSHSVELISQDVMESLTESSVVR